MHISLMLFRIYMVLYPIILRLTEIYLYAIIIYCILSMCLGSGIIRHPFAYKAYEFLARLIEPALTPIRSILPDFGSFDFAPIVLIFILDYGIPYCLKKIFLLLYLSSSQF